MAKRLLNVGGGPVPPSAQYKDWEIVLLDIDPSVNPDICLDARELLTLEPEQYDCVYASHVLEHFYEHDHDKILWGFYHVLKRDGFADIRVPDLEAVMRASVQKDLSLTGVLYNAPVGPIRVCDVLFGWQERIRESGTEFYAHRSGFDRDTLGRALEKARFEHVLIGASRYELRSLAYKHHPERHNGH